MSYISDLCNEKSSPKASFCTYFDENDLHAACCSYGVSHSACAYFGADSETINGQVCSSGIVEIHGACEQNDPEGMVCANDGTEAGAYWPKSKISAIYQLVCATWMKGCNEPSLESSPWPQRSSEGSQSPLPSPVAGRGVADFDAGCGPCDTCTYTCAPGKSNDEHCETDWDVDLNMLR